MNEDFSLIVLIVGLVRPLLWWAGAVLAFYRKRWAVCSGFALAGCNSLVLAFYNAQARVPDTLVEAAASLQVLVAGLIVFGFIAAQPKRARRPGSWSP